MNSLDINILFKRIAKGDPLAYEQVFAEYAGSIYNVAFAFGRNRELAEDAVQQVFLKLWEKRETLIEVEHPESWLHTAARYQMIDMLDKEFTRLRHSRAAGGYAFLEQKAQPEQMMEKHRAKIVQEAINQLPAKQQKIYRMVREEGLGYAEIGRLMGLSRETIKDYMSQALKTLKKTLLMQKDRLLVLSALILKNII